MTAAVSSAQPFRLYRYSDVCTRIDNELVAEAGRLTATLRHFEARCTEYRVHVSHLGDQLRQYGQWADGIDRWVREVGVGFERADRSALVKGVLLSSIAGLSVASAEGLLDQPSSWFEARRALTALLVAVRWADGLARYRQGEYTATQLPRALTVDLALVLAEVKAVKAEAIGGTELGALLGAAIMPGVGTIAGAIVGGIVGAHVAKSLVSGVSQELDLRERGIKWLDDHVFGPLARTIAAGVDAISRWIEAAAEHLRQQFRNVQAAAALRVIEIQSSFRRGAEDVRATVRLMGMNSSDMVRNAFGSVAKAPWLRTSLHHAPEIVDLVKDRNALKAFIRGVRFHPQAGWTAYFKETLRGGYKGTWIVKGSSHALRDVGMNPAVRKFRQGYVNKQLRIEGNSSFAGKARGASSRVPANSSYHAISGMKHRLADAFGVGKSIKGKLTSAGGLAVLLTTAFNIYEYQFGENKHIGVFSREFLTSTVADSSAHLGIVAVSTAVGSLIPIPFVGTAVGFAVGVGLSYVYEQHLKDKWRNTVDAAGQRLQQGFLNGINTLSAGARNFVTDLQYRFERDIARDAGSIARRLSGSVLASSAPHLTGLVGLGGAVWSTFLPRRQPIGA